jgi:membrane protease YdiL (CAAX protease family)
MFFLIAYAISWTSWITLFALHYSPFAWPGRWLYLTAVLAPHAAAVVITSLEGGRARLRAFYSRVIRAVPFRTAIVAICIPPIIYLVRDAISVGLLLPHDAFFHRPPRSVMALIFGQLAVVVGEEPGWRGFALPHLIARSGPIIGTLVLGVAWACWHLPLFMIAGTPQYGTGFLPFALLLMAWSMVITLFIMHARGSVIPAMLFHASANVCAFTMSEPDVQLFALAPWIITAGLAAWWMQSKLTHQPLTPGVR